MDSAGCGKPDWPDIARDNWSGPYATLRAAIDMARQAGRDVRGADCCLSWTFKATP